jgi:hypothetical protein
MSDFLTNDKKGILEVQFPIFLINPVAKKTPRHKTATKANFNVPRLFLQDKKRVVKVVKWPKIVFSIF